MKKLHHRLRRTYHWYDMWHNHPKHNLFHWLSLVAFSELAFLFVLTVTAMAAGQPIRKDADASGNLCRRSPATIDIQGPAAATGIEIPDTFHMTITNNDKNCGNSERFNTQIKVSDGTGLTIAPKVFSDSLDSETEFITQGRQTGGKISTIHTFTVTPRTGVAAGARTITVSTRHVKWNIPATEGSIAYTIGGSDNPGTGSCSHSAPTVAITPADQDGGPGDALTYTLTVTNNDTTACAKTKFSFSATSDSSIIVNNLNPLQAGAGKTETAVFVVRSKPLSQPRDYNFNISISGSVPEHTAEKAAQGTYHVASGAPDDKCKRNAPTVAVSERRKSGAAGSAVPYEVTVTNNDRSNPGKSCGGSNFTVDATPGTLPAGWTTAPATFALEAGRQYRASLSVTAPANADLRDYNFTIAATNKTSAMTSSAAPAVFAVTPSEGSTGEPEIRIISPTDNPYHAKEDFTITALVTGVYKVDEIFFKENSGLFSINPPECKFTGVSVCSATIHVTAWTPLEAHDIIAIAKKNGGKTSKPAHISALFDPDQPVGTGARVDLQANPATVMSGGSTTLSWSAIETSNCVASSKTLPEGSPSQTWTGAKTVEGTETISNLTASTKFILSCGGYHGDVDVVVTPAPPVANPFCTSVNPPAELPYCIRLSGKLANGTPLANGMVTGGDFELTATVYGEPDIDKLRLVIDGNPMADCERLVKPLNGKFCMRTISTSGWGTDGHTLLGTGRKDGAGVINASPYAVPWTVYKK